MLVFRVLNSTVLLAKNLSMSNIEIVFYNQLVRIIS